MENCVMRLRALKASFGASQSGNVAMIFGLMLVPLLTVSGGAIDYGRAVSLKSRLQGIVDASANAGARLPATANRNREEAVLGVFNANIAGTELAGAQPQVQASFPSWR